MDAVGAAGRAAGAGVAGEACASTELAHRTQAIATASAVAGRARRAGDGLVIVDLRKVAWQRGLDPRTGTMFP
jgi:hypothetical protein